MAQYPKIESIASIILAILEVQVHLEHVSAMMAPGLQYPVAEASPCMTSNEEPDLP